nr:hypothetical protein [Tanacetum cinerariifolium]
MGYEHLNTISETEFDEVIESSAKNILPIPIEYEVTFDDEKINSNEIDLHYFNTKSDFLKSLCNRDTLIDSSPKFDFIEEFFGTLMHTSVADEECIRREHEEYTSLMEKLFSINSVPHPLENFHANTIDSEGDIHFLEELLVNDSIPIPENGSSDFDHQDDPSFPRPPPKPPDTEFFFDLEPEVIAAVMNDIDELNKDECFDPGGEINVFANVEDDDYFPFIFVIQIFLPYFIYPEVSPLLLSAEMKTPFLTLAFSLKLMASY